MSAATRRASVLAACLGALAWLSRDAAFAGAGGAPARSARTQLRALEPAVRKEQAVVDPLSYGAKKGPIVTYAGALMEAAANKGQSVQVTKDVMRIKKRLQSQQFVREITEVMMDPATENQLVLCQEYIKIFEPFESDIMPKFMTFLAKKRRFESLRLITEQYMLEAYEQQGIEPVTVISATPLSDEQVEKLKAKMAATTGATDIKLLQKLDPGLVAGMVIEYGYDDPEDMSNPSNSLDLSLKTTLRKAALKEGVLVA